jgi:UDP-N-acetylmuramate
LSLATADFPVVAAVDHPDKVALEERLDLTKLSSDLSALGKDALIGGHAQEIVSAVCKKAQPGDVILVMSNGGFEGIHAKLLEALNA